MIATHLVPAEQFDGLARGGGGVPAVSTLRAGQLSKRVLQIRALLELAATGLATIEETAAAEHAFAVLADARRTAPATTDQVLLYPPVGAWAAHCVARLRPTADGPRLTATEAGLGQLGAIAASAAVLAARSDSTIPMNPDPAAAEPDRVRVSVPMRNGRVVLPMVGRVVLTGRPEHGVATVQIDRATISIRSDTSTVTLPADLTVDDGCWRALRRLRTGSGDHQLEVWLDDEDPFREYAGLDLATELGEGDVSQWRSALGQAWNLLTSHHPDSAKSLAAGMVSLVPLVATEDGRGVSATAVNAFGAAAMTPPVDGPTLAVGLIHEFQHSKLSALLDLVPLYDRTNPVLLYAPWRDDPRPLGGLLQGAYAYIGVTSFWAQHRHLVGGDGSTFAHFQFARWREQAARATEVIAGSGCLTEAGDRFVAGMREALGEWASEPVPAEALRAARDATLDHWLTWRLRNLCPDPEAVAALADEYLAGAARPRSAAPPNVPVPGRFAPAPNDRLTLLHQRLRTETPSLGVSAADLAYDRGDLRNAETGYRVQIKRDPDAGYAWAGLALTLRSGGTRAGQMLGRCPELVASVYRCVGDRNATPTDPVVLADWLAELEA